MSYLCHKKLKTDKNCSSVNRSTADCKCLNQYPKKDVHKLKRLKSRKERSNIRDGGKEASKSKSHQHLCCRKIRKDMAHFHNCCHSSCQFPSRRDAPFPRVIPAGQEPSFITDSRLIGHHGLFNHEVKSIDIERLLSEQKKIEKSEQVRQNSIVTSCPPSTSPILSPFSTNNLLGADTSEDMQLEKNADHSMTAYDECQEKEKSSQGSNLTPGQRPLQQLASGSFKSIVSSKHSSLDVVVIKNCKTYPDMSEKGREAQLTPTLDRENVKTLNKNVKAHMSRTLKHTPKNQTSPVHQTQAFGLSPSPVQLPSLHTADGFDIQHRRQDLDPVSKSVSVVAAGLCNSLQFPLLRRRSLVEESREVLLKALRERHGPQLQENLFKVQQCLSFRSEPAKKVQDQEPTMADEDAFAAVFQASQPCFASEKTSSFTLTRSKHFNWKSSPQLHHNLKQTAEWLTNPVETLASCMDEIIRPTHSPLFCMDFEPSGVTASDHLFAPSPTSCFEEKASKHWEDRFSKPKSKEDVMFGSFENSFMNHSKAVTERSSGSQYCHSNVQTFFPRQANLPHRHLAEPLHFPLSQDQFESDKYSFAPSFFGQIHHPQHHFQPLSQSSHPSTQIHFRSHHIDMMHYPPSHVLEGTTTPPRSSFPSPEQWSFPPMRLY